MLYFDNAATTVPMVKFEPITGLCLNANTPYAVNERNALQEAEDIIKRGLHANPDDGIVLWFNGATQAIEWLVNQIRIKYPWRNIGCSPVEHHSVIHALDEYGYSNQGGILYRYNINEMQASITSRNRLPHSQIYFYIHQLVNQLNGTVFDLPKIRKDLEKSLDPDNVPIFLLTDATAFVGKEKFDYLGYNITECCDAIWFSGHKFHVPCGIGGMWINTRLLRFLYQEYSHLDIQEILHETKNQHGLVYGTPPVDLIRYLANGFKYFTYPSQDADFSCQYLNYGFVECCRRMTEAGKLPQLIHIDTCPNKNIQQYSQGCLDNIMLVRFPGINAENLATWLASQNCFISTANSACEAYNDYTVLHNLGIKDHEEEYIRLSFDAYTNTQEDIGELVRLISQFYMTFVKEDELND